MQVLTFLNEKGGVGKTTLAVNVGAGLAMRGLRVIVIDGDPQASATLQLQVHQVPALHDLLIRESKWNQQGILQVAPPEAWADGQPKGQLLVVAGNVETQVIPLLTKDSMKLQKRLAELQNWADLVIIDTSPTPSMLHAMFYMASDAIVFPTTCEMLSLEGIANTVEHVSALNATRATHGLKEVKILGIQPMLYAKTNSHNYGIEKLKESFGNLVYPPISRLTAWQDASWALMSIFAYDPQSQAAREAMELIERIGETLGVLA